jgi:hypothetical protein
MKIFLTIGFMLAVLAVLSSMPAVAQTNRPYPEVMGNRPLIAPYLYDGYSSHNQTLRHEDWELADWAPTRADARRMVGQFVRLNIFTDGTPWRSAYGADRVRVGHGFYRLSAFDQRRVLSVFDALYGSTRKTAGTLFLEDDDTGRVIGLYTPWGLQLQ